MPNRKNNSESDNLPRAVSAIVFAVCTLSFGDALIKWFSLSLPVWQLLVLRSAIVLPILVAAIKIWRPTVSLLPSSILWVAIRSLFLASMLIAYYLALPHLQLSIAAAAYYTSPIFITLFSKLVVGEPVGPKGWLAIGLGFTGAVIVLRPDIDGFNVFALLPVAAAIFYALAMTLTRTKCRNEDALVLTAAMNVVLIIIGATVSIALIAVNLDPSEMSQNRFLLGAWTSVGWWEISTILMLAAAFCIGSLFVAIAYQSAASSIVSTFDFSYLAFSVLWGVLLFAELPDPLTLVGIFMIAAAGVIALLRR